MRETDGRKCFFCYICYICSCSYVACVAGALVGTYYQNIDTNMSFIAGMKTFAAAASAELAHCPEQCLAELSLDLQKQSEQAILVQAIGMQLPLQF